MEESKFNSSEKIQAILTNEDLFKKAQEQILEASCGIRLEVADIVLTYKVVDGHCDDISELFEVLSECNEEEKHKLIFHHANYLINVINYDDLVEDTKDYLLDSQELTETISSGLASVKSEILDDWSDEQIEAYQNGEYDKLPDITPEYVNWDESELVYFRCKYAKDKALELKNGGYFLESHIYMGIDDAIWNSIDHAISATWEELDGQDIDYVVSYLKSRNLHDKIQNDMNKLDCELSQKSSKADKLVSSINPDAETTTKKNSTKLKL